MFIDRTDAGKKLAHALRHFDGAAEGVVLGVPRGGVVVAAEISRLLRLPLDVFVSRRFVAPWNETIALGAVTETKEVFLNDFACQYKDLPSEVLGHKVQDELLEIELLKGRYRSGLPLVPVKNKIVLLIDDCIVSGDTLLGAARALRKLGPRRLIGAIPVGPAHKVAQLARLVDELVALDVPGTLASPSDHYQRFPTVEDDEVCRHLKTHHVAA